MKNYTEQEENDLIDAYNAAKSSKTGGKVGMQLWFSRPEIPSSPPVRTQCIVIDIEDNEIIVQDPTGIYRIPHYPKSTLGGLSGVWDADLMDLGPNLQPKWQDYYEIIKQRDLKSRRLI